MRVLYGGLTRTRGELGEKKREVERLTAQLTALDGKYHGATAALRKERERVRTALLQAEELAETSIEFSAEEEGRLRARVDGGEMGEVTAEEVHWLMTKPFRGWLAQSYAECDEVCDALEAEQQRHKRLAQAKDAEVGKMRQRVGRLHRAAAAAHRIFAAALAAAVATGVAGAWRAHTAAAFAPSLQLMAVAWTLIGAVAAALLVGDAAAPAPLNLPPPRELNLDRAPSPDPGR